MQAYWSSCYSYALHSSYVQAYDFSAGSSAPRRDLAALLRHRVWKMQMTLRPDVPACLAVAMAPAKHRLKDEEEGERNSYGCGSRSTALSPVCLESANRNNRVRIHLSPVISLLSAYSGILGSSAASHTLEGPGTQNIEPYYGRGQAARPVTLLAATFEASSRPVLERFCRPP